ncbi:MAG: hypothetical protein OWQ55_05855, partial [Sulfuracidifex metallicus]|nr:hypothetical protein [Sulfuracidifex metallicus]
MDHHTTLNPTITALKFALNITEIAITRIMAGNARMGAIVYPGYIDAHGGVQYNQQNDYVNQHGAIGSGPYMISS